MTLMGYKVVEPDDPGPRWLGNIAPLGYFGPTYIAEEFTGESSTITSIPEGFDLFVNGQPASLGHVIKRGDSIHMKPSEADQPVVVDSTTTGSSP